MTKEQWEAMKENIKQILINLICGQANLDSGLVVIKLEPINEAVTEIDNLVSEARSIEYQQGRAAERDSIITRLGGTVKEKP